MSAGCARGHTRSRGTTTQVELPGRAPSPSYDDGADTANRALWQDRDVRHVYHCPLRWADMDSLGHVNNVTYVDYLQEARVDMFAVHAPASGGEELAEGVVVVRHEVEFVAPLVFRFEPVRIETWITEIKAASFTMAYEILDELPDGTRKVYTRATSVLTPFVFAQERPRRLRPEERDVLERFLEPAPASGGAS